MSEQAPRSTRRAAAGPGAVLSTALRVAELGLARGLDVLTHVNQIDGFDCPGCAWPESLPRHRFEFCENGAKAVAHEATRKHAAAYFPEANSLVPADAFAAGSRTPAYKSLPISLRLEADPGA